MTFHSSDTYRLSQLCHNPPAHRPPPLLINPGHSVTSCTGISTSQGLTADVPLPCSSCAVSAFIWMNLSHVAEAEAPPSPGWPCSSAFPCTHRKQQGVGLQLGHASYLWCFGGVRATESSKSKTWTGNGLFQGFFFFSFCLSVPLLKDKKL